MFVNHIDKPGPVDNLKVTNMTEDSVSLSWLPPDDDGDALIERYIIEKVEGTKRAWQPDGTCEDVEYTSSGLREGQQYRFQVAAENEVGQGPFTEISKPVTPKSQHGRLKDSLGIIYSF